MYNSYVRIHSSPGFPRKTSAPLSQQLIPMAFNFMYSLFAAILFIFPFLPHLNFFKSKRRELPLPPGTLGWPTWPCIGEISFASKLKRYGSIFFRQGRYKFALCANMPKAIKSIVSDIKSVAKDSFPSMKGRLIVTSPEMKAAGLVAFPQSMKKVVMLVTKARPFALTLLLLSAKAAEAAGRPPTFNYGIIKNNGNAPPSTSTHSPPANDPTRGCNPENYCRHFTLTAENPSGTTRIEAVAKVDVRAPLNRNAPGLEAIAGGIATWSLNNTKSGRLSVSMNATADADSAQVLRLKLAFSRGIARKGLDVQYRSASMSSEDMAALPPVDGNIIITVGAASNHVDLKFMTNLESFGETDVIWILDDAKANI